MLDKELHTLLVRAVAGDGCSRATGEIRDLMVIVNAYDEDHAHERALWALSGRGWVSAELVRQWRAEDDPGLDPVFRDAVCVARERGDHVMVYEP